MINPRKKYIFLINYKSNLNTWSYLNGLDSGPFILREGLENKIQK